MRDMGMKTSVVHRRFRLYQGSHFSFDREDITLPNGVRTELAMVRHPGSAAVVPFLDADTIILIRQFRHPVGEAVLEIPSGTMERGETDPLACARRELTEETGFEASEFVDLGAIYILPSYSDEKIHLYLARNLKKSRQNLDQDEIIEVIRVPIEEAMRMIDRARIVDALTILAVQMAWRFKVKEEAPPKMAPRSLF